MYRKTQFVLAWITLCVGLVSSFSWDIIVARSNRLEFYNEGILVHLATPASHRINWISYDPVHERVLFSEKYNRDDSASSFDIANQTTQSLIKNKADRYLKRFAYDPATELLFGTVTKSIYSFPLEPENNEVNGDLVITLETIPREVAVDSCGGYVYWTTNNIIERALFNGSEREVIIENNVTLRQGLTIDTQKMYWIESQEFSDGGFSIESADLNGKNRKTLYCDKEADSTPDKLTVSKDFISWGDSIETFFWQLLKHPSNDRDVRPSKIAMNTTIFACVSHDIVGNYKIEERTQRIPKCNALLSLLPDYHVCLKASAFCVHGTKVIGESRCDCIQGYIGERCDVSICENYCLQGDCSVSAEGQPTCRCNAGHTGTRCEVSVCHRYCLHNGVCSLNEKNEAVCECTGLYEGERCDVLTNLKAGPTSDVEDRSPTAMNQTIETTTASNTDVEYNITFTTTADTPTTIHENIESTTNKSFVVPTTMVYTTKASNTDVENNITFTTTTDTPTTIQENIESITSNSFVAETNLTSDADKNWDFTTTTEVDIMNPTTASNTDVGNNITLTTTTDTPTTIQENIESITSNSFIAETNLTSNADKNWDFTTTTKVDIINPTTASNTDVGNNITLTTTTDTPTTIQENIESITSNSFIAETNLTSDADENWDFTITTEVEIMNPTTASNTDVGSNITLTTTTDTPTTIQEHIESITSNSFVAETTLPSPHKGFHWLPLVDGKLPPNAIVGGFEDGNAIYIARARYSGSLCPGKYVESTGIAYFPWGGLEHIIDDFEILCGHNPKWVKTNYDNIPKNAFVGGTSERIGEPLYICRDNIDDRLICGKVDTHYKLCYLPYNGDEKEVYSYEILVEE